MPRRTRWCGSRPVMSCPSRRILPAVGRVAPLRRLMTVVLPAPFGPIRAWRAPFLIRNDTWLVALMPPKDLARSMVSSAYDVSGAEDVSSTEGLLGVEDMA